jgi:hypothetical protein
VVGNGGDGENKFSTPTAPQQRILLMYNPLDRRSFLLIDDALGRTLSSHRATRSCWSMTPKNDAKEGLNMLAAIFPEVMHTA